MAEELFELHRGVDHDKTPRTFLVHRASKNHVVAITSEWGGPMGWGSGTAMNGQILALLWRRRWRRLDIVCGGLPHQTINRGG